MSYELFNNKTPSTKYFKIFGCKIYILNTKDNLSKFSSKVNERIFIGYSKTSKGYKIYNKKTIRLGKILDDSTRN